MNMWEHVEGYMKIYSLQAMLSLICLLAIHEECPLGKSEGAQGCKDVTLDVSGELLQLLLTGQQSSLFVCFCAAPPDPQGVQPDIVLYTCLSFSAFQGS